MCNHFRWLDMHSPFWPQKHILVTNIQAILVVGMYYQKYGSLSYWGVFYWVINAQGKSWDVLSAILLTQTRPSYIHRDQKEIEQVTRNND